MTAALNGAERALAQREATRLVDIVMGRDDGRSEVCHYLVVERSSLLAFGPKSLREIEQYRDVERAIANAADCETGEREARWLGAFTATYRDGRLVAIALIDDLPALIEARRTMPAGERLGRHIGAPMLKEQGI